MVPAKAAQDHLKTDTEIRGPVLQFDWPAIQIGIGSYEEGPTGLTIFRFSDSAVAAVDVRGAFRQIDDLKVAAFVVVNSSGAITDRDGRMVKFGNKSTGLPKASDLLASLPESRSEDWIPKGSNPSKTGGHHTTTSLVVTNQKLRYAALQRLAVQVHTSMARGIQPFSTDVDGDTLFALATQEVSSASPALRDLNTIASEVMWDAILTSVPEEPSFIPPPSVDLSSASLTKWAGSFRFGPKAILQGRV